MEFNKIGLKVLESQVELAANPPYLELKDLVISSRKDLKADYLCHPIPNTNKFIIYSIEKEEGMIKEVPEENNLFPVYSGIAADKEYIYIIGGTKNFIEPSDEAFKVSVKNLITYPLKKLNAPRYQCSLTKSDNLLICVGGRGRDDLLDTIELMDMNKNIDWIFGPRLPLKLCLCSCASIVNDMESIVFVFGGLYIKDNSLTVSNKMYKFHVGDMAVTTLDINDLPCLYSAGMILKNYKNDKFEILIFGGSLLENGKKQKEKLQIREYKVTEDNVTADNQLAKEDIFSNGNLFVEEDGTIFAMGTESVHRNYHGKWEEVPEISWLSL